MTVTGASGFIGRRLAVQLASQGARVRALVRNRHDLGALRRDGIEIIHGSLDDEASLAASLKGCGTLFHFAYDVRASGAKNLSSFNMLLDAAVDAGVALVVQASSAVVYDAWPDGVIDETMPETPAGDQSYRDTKIAMENALLDSSIDRVAILQPTIVYGPGGGMWTTRPINWMRSGGVKLPEPAGHCPAIFVDDLVDAALRAAVCDALGKDRFLLTGPDAPSWLDFFTAYRDIAGKGDITLVPKADLMRENPVNVVPVSGPTVAARVSAVLRRIIGSQRLESLVQGLKTTIRGASPHTPSPGELILFSSSPKISTARATNVLGWTPQTDFAQGIGAIVDDRT